MHDPFEQSLRDMLSLIRQGLTGKDADAALGRAHITVNRAQCLGIGGIE